MIASAQTPVELRVYARANEGDTLRKTFSKVLHLSAASLSALRELGTKIPPIAEGLKEGVVRNVGYTKGSIQIWVEIQSHPEDLQERLPSAGWKEISEQSE